MSGQEGLTAPSREQAALLTQGPAETLDVEGQDTAAMDSSGGSNGETRWQGLWTWLRGRRSTHAQRLPTEDEEGDELQQRQQVAVVVEAAREAAEAAGDGGPPRAQQLQQQQAQQQQAGEDVAGTSSSSTGGGGGGEIEPRGSGSAGMARLPSRGPPTCLICLEEFTQEEFVNGAALRLECNCRGDLALRHRDCVMKWVQVKGSNVCELCKAEIRNIPAPPPRPTEADLPTLDEAYFNDPSHIHDFMPSSQDLVFDCIRVTWVAMIVSILFFEMSLGAALWTGLLAGCAYSIMVRLMYRQHFYAMRRLAEQQSRDRRQVDEPEEVV